MRNLSFTVNDGGASSNSITSTVSVTAVNDAPVSTNATVTIAQNAIAALTAATFGGYSDAEGDALAAVQITTLESAGSLEYDGTGAGAWTAVTLNQVVSAADIAAGRLRFVPDANANGAGYATIGFKVSDGTAFSAAAYTLTADISAPPAAPVGQFVALAPQAVQSNNQLPALAVSPASSSQNGIPPLIPAFADRNPTQSGNGATLDDVLIAPLPEPLAALRTSGTASTIGHSSLRYGLREFVISAGTAEVQGSELATLRTSGRVAPILLLQEDLGSSRSSPLLEAMDQMRESIDNQSRREHLLSAAAAAVGLSFSVGYLVWLVRGGVLLSSLLSSLPAWRMLDPLPVLARVGDEEDDEDVDTFTPPAEVFR